MPEDTTSAAPTGVEASTATETKTTEEGDNSGQKPASAAPTGVASSGEAKGPNGPFPAELKGWNWGAFFLTWIWAIGHQTWIGLLALLGMFFWPVSLIMAIILGLKGNEWAWANKKYESVEQFRSVERVWAIWGLVLTIVSIVVMAIFWGFIIAMFSSDISSTILSPSPATTL